MNCLLGAGVLGDGLGDLKDVVLGELTREEKPDSGLDLTGGDGGSLGVLDHGLGHLRDVVLGELTGKDVLDNNLVFRSARECSANNTKMRHHRPCGDGGGERDQHGCHSAARERHGHNNRAREGNTSE